MTELVVSTGWLSGRDIESGVTAYLGIPYAAPPVGPLRFAPPQPIASWLGVRDATRFGPAAPQAVAASLRVLADMSAGVESEDCLVLNVWTPGGNGRPVMVFIHGGAFITGAGSVAMYDGAALSASGSPSTIASACSAGFAPSGSERPATRDWRIRPPSSSGSSVRSLRSAATLATSPLSVN